MSGIGHTVRFRLTAAVVVIVGVVAIAAALLVPRVVRSTLVDDLLDAESVEIAADPLTPVGQAVTVITAGFDDAELSTLFGPEIDELTTALAETGVIDELRAQRSDGALLVVAAPDVVGAVHDDGAIAVERVDPSTLGPVVTTSQLQSLADAHDVDWFTFEPFEVLVDGDQSLLDLLEDFGFGGEFFDDELFSDLGPLIEDELGPLIEDGTPLPFDLERFIEDLQTPDEVIGVPPPNSDLETDTAAADIELAYGVRDIDDVELIVATPVGSVERSVDRLTTALWIAAPIAMLLVGIATWLIAGRALRPVRTITERTAAIRGGALHERVPVPGSNDEINALATEMNDMLARLQADDARRRQFVSDASHELRSPIAAIQTQTEATLRDDPDPETERLATGVLAEAERMGVLVADLLALARHDEGLAPPAPPIDLDDVILAEAARARRVRIDTGAVSAGQIRGRSDEFTRVVAHLLDNAARHAETRVAVSLHTEGDRVTLCVDDDGPGIPAGERERVLERFVRLDEARERDTGGAGLGLAVVASVARASGGRVSISESPLGGTRVELDLPAAS